MIAVFQLMQKSLVVDNNCFKVSGVVAAVQTRFVVDVTRLVEIDRVLCVVRRLLSS